MAPLDLATNYGSCVACDLHEVTLPEPPPQLGLPGSPGTTGFNSDGAIVTNLGNFSGAWLPPAIIGGNVDGYRFDGAILDGATFITQVDGASFVNLQSSIGTTFEGAAEPPSTPKSDFTGANLSRAIFQGSFADQQFLNVTVNGTNFAGADFGGVTFQFKPFSLATPPSFAGATLYDSDTDNGLPCPRFQNSPLLGVSFEGATLDPCTGPLFPNSDVPLLAVRQLLVDDKITGIDFTNAEVVASVGDHNTFAGLDLAGIDLAGIAVVGVPLDLTGTILDNATVTGFNFGLATLSGASLKNISAAGASFDGADLSSHVTGQDAANLSGADTNLQNASFVDATLDGAEFASADISGANFNGARGEGTDFTGVTARGAQFTEAHLTGNGEAFHNATDMQNVDFSGAVLVNDITNGGGFNLSGADLTNAIFDGAQCVNCNLKNATLTGASFTRAYLPGVQLPGAANLSQASFDRAWLYCGSLSNGSPCTLDQGTWEWPLKLGSGELSGSVPFDPTNAATVDMSLVKSCPQGKLGALPPAGCSAQYLLPAIGEGAVLPPPCSASARGACPTFTSTLAQSPAKPLDIAAVVPPTLNTDILGEGYYVGLDDSTLRVLVGGTYTTVAGAAGTACSPATATCGDNGPASSALLARPAGVAVDLDGSVYIADAGVRRIRKIGPSGTITTVAGTGAACTTGACGDGGPATTALLNSANDVAVDVQGQLLIADGPGGVRRVGLDGTISTLAAGATIGNAVSVAIGADGTIYAAVRNPDAIVAIDPASGAVTTVVGTGTSGYNSNSDDDGNLLPGTQVQVNQPSGLSVDLDGNVLFADTGNHLIRAYVPAEPAPVPVSGTVIDDLAGYIAGGTTPQGGFNNDGHYAPATELNGPLAVAATGSALLVVADTGNNRVRQTGPAPLGSDATQETPKVMLSCGPGRTFTCERLPAPNRPVTLPVLGPVTVTYQGTTFATGHWLRPNRGRPQFLLTETKTLVPGKYQLHLVLGHRNIALPMTITP